MTTSAPSSRKACARSSSRSILLCILIRGDAFSAALGRKIRYVPLEWDEWKATTLKEHVSKGGWEQHAANHLANLARLVQKGTVEVSPNVELLTGSPGMDYGEWVKQHAEEFTKK
ncbi:unnamed protein product [Rotaria sordida]|uniref:Uncharacterized protein n=1 Tax=Rotaria sordida TaxID=392033 RepID=A0A814SMT5_9BILA|nr:unnamed protein product [Rotaria sordida]